jgi:predicted RNase H-like nuclease (RuvC/YqgF family)
MLQSTIQNLSNEVRELKKKNEELEKTLLNLSQKNEMTIARFHGSSNLNNK